MAYDIYTFSPYLSSVPL